MTSTRTRSSADCGEGNLARKMARAAVLIATALVLAGCGSSNESEEQAEPAPTQTATTPACEPLPGASTEKQERPAPASVAPIFLTDVQLEARECSDHVAFTFRDHGSTLPGYTVSYEPGSTAKVEDASGRHIEVAGTAFLVVRLMNVMTAEISGEDVTPTYTGPRRIPGDETRFVREVVKTGDFEAMVTWVIGVEGKRPFTATASGSRLVIELTEKS
jgi:hypothetical protein